VVRRISLSSRRALWRGLCVKREIAEDTVPEPAEGRKSKVALKKPFYPFYFEIKGPNLKYFPKRKL